MELQSISQIANQFNISTRTLRYYEQIGLINPVKTQGMTRIYNETAVLRLKQIIVLRKLRIPLKQIAEILDSDNAAVAINVFQQNLTEIEDEINALSTIKSIIEAFTVRLNIESHELQLLDDESLLEIVDSLTISKINFKEEKVTMDDLNKANERLNKLTDRDVRIIYLPPATIAAAHYIGEGPEGPSNDMLHEFIRNSNLIEIYPAARCYGFNHPNPGMREDGKYGYEFQVTIPDDMDVPSPLEKKRFDGGLYAAYMILMDEIAGIGWTRLFDGWLKGHELWESNMSPSGENMNGLLEEHLDILHWQDKGHLAQVDLLLPVKRKEQ